MQTQAAVLYAMEAPKPYRQSRPLRIETLELEGPGQGEVLVEIAAAGLCHSDLSVINGSRPRVMPMVMGHEASGTILETGAGVKGLRPGDAVVFSFMPTCGCCRPCSEGRATLCENGAEANVAGTLLNGRRRFRTLSGKPLHHHLGVSGFSRYTVTVPESLIKIPPDMDSVKAALFGCAVVTGVGAVVNRARVEPGASVAVFGLGGVGLSAVAGARASGAYPIVAVDRLESKRGPALAMGASHFVNAAQEGSIEAVREICRGGAKYAFEAVGHAKVLAQAYAATARGGITVTVGLPHPEQQLSIPAVSLVGEERTLMGSYMGSAVPSRDIPRFMEMYRQGILPIDPLFSREIKLEEINEAFDELDEGKAIRQMVTFA